MSLLPCDGDLVALGVVVDGYLDRDGLGKHMSACRPCASVYRAMAKAMGARGGAAGRGAAKRRGSSEHYRRLAQQSWNPPQQADQAQGVVLAAEKEQPHGPK